MDAEAAARAWVEGWRRAWLAKDADGVAALYGEGAVFRSHPFREQHVGPDGAREYALWAFESEEALEVWFGEPVVSGNRAAVEYWAIILEDGKEMTLAGAAHIRFGVGGLVEAQRDYWSMEEGRREPPAGWGS